MKKILYFLVGAAIIYWLWRQYEKSKAAPISTTPIVTTPVVTTPVVTTPVVTTPVVTTPTTAVDVFPISLPFTLI
jgi:hypothetical protein